MRLAVKATAIVTMKVIFVFCIIHEPMFSIETILVRLMASLKRKGDIMGIVILRAFHPVLNYHHTFVEICLPFHRRLSKGRNNTRENE